jgi:hypothetical protein
MLKRLRAVLVESFVGAIALGWLLAQGVLHFAYIFSSPIAGWFARREYHRIVDQAVMSPTAVVGSSTAFSLQDALPELVRSLSILLVAYLLLRWLYFKPIESQTSKPSSEQGG